jgi:hypothetical protein
MVSLFAENGDGPGPGGAKGLAEGGLLAIAPAIAAAILDCAGVHVKDLPFTPERVWHAMRGSHRLSAGCGSFEAGRAEAPSLGREHEDGPARRLATGHRE